MVRDEKAVAYLNYLYRQYDGITRLISQAKQRICAMPGMSEDDYDTCLNGEKNAEGMLTVKGRLSRSIEKELSMWPVWEAWLKYVPGIGPTLGAGLILTYYYKHIPICKECGGNLEKQENGDNGNVFVCVDCGKASKGDGVLKHRLDFRDFATISKWWAFMGRHTVDGVMPKRKKGVVANWSTPGRTLGYHIGDQFNRQQADNPYKAFLLERKEKHARNHPDWTKGHIHNAAKNETTKLFLSHFWVVTRMLEGKDISEPYAGTIMGHTNIIKPFYWEG
jgi:uncharacterized protein (DUF983 family)